MYKLSLLASIYLSISIAKLLKMTPAIYLGDLFMFYLKSHSKKILFELTFK